MRLFLRSRWWSYAAAVGAIVLAIALGTRGVVQGLAGPGDVGLVTDSSSYDVGDTIIFSGNLDFALGDVATTTAVLLSLSGPQSMTTGIPLLPGSHDLSDGAGVTGRLLVEVTFNNVSEIGGGANVFKGMADGARIVIRAEWTPDQSSASSGTYTAALSVDVEGMAAPITSAQAQFTIAAPPVPPPSQGAGIPAATKTATRTPRPTRTPTATASRTATPSPTPTNTAEPTATSTATPTASPTLSPTPSPVPRPSPSPVIMPTAIVTSSSTPLPSPTYTPLPTPSASPTPFPTPTPTALVVAVLAAEDTVTPTSVAAIPAGLQAIVEDQKGDGFGVGVIALMVLGVAVGAGLIAVVRIPLLRG